MLSIQPILCRHILRNPLFVGERAPNTTFLFSDPKGRTPYGADPSTYTPRMVHPGHAGAGDLSSGFSVDAHQSTGRNELVGADPQTFSSLELTGYGKDALHVYYTDHVVDAADATTFS
jgi:hypothetical protein